MKAEEFEQVFNDLVEKHSPNLSRSILINSTSQALANANHNATTMQQQQNIIINTSASLSTALIYSIGAAQSKK